MSGDVLSNIFGQESERFNSRFSNTFNLAQKGYDHAHIKFAQTLLSNLIGGIGHFHGHAIVDRGLEGFDEDQPVDFVDETDDGGDYFTDQESEAPSRPVAAPILEGPFTLFTATPSRPFFPRGYSLF